MKFLDLFAGIGGFRLGLEMVGHECVGHVEIDKYAHKSYVAMHKPKEGEYYADDIRNVKPEDLPEFDILTGGFPCQSFSIAGKRGGFTDTRGTLFFEIMRIASIRKPKYLFLENVKGLLSHDGGKTFGTILSTLWECGYDAEWQVCNSKNYGVPQNRERIFIIGQRREDKKNNIFPIERTEINGTEIEKMYLLSTGISSHIGKLQGTQNKKNRESLSRREMQALLEKLQQEIQEGKCIEVQKDTEGMEFDAEGSLQEIKTKQRERTLSDDKPKEFRGLVSIPREEMLLLWLRGEQVANGKGFIQQQDLQAIHRQNRFIEGLRRGEYGSLLFAVQSYQGKLFYSVGNGRDWVKIYSKEVGKWNKRLNCISEEQVEDKYFLSDTASQRLLSYKDNQQIPLQREVEKQKAPDRMLLKVNSMKTK